MKPKKLTLCAWGPFCDKEEVDFTVFEQKGIFLITGPTGAGKTTIFDAISYALYGALSGETHNKERESVRSDYAQAQTPTYVELWMEHGGKEYHIRRNPEYLRPKKRKSSGEDAALEFTKEKENAVLTFEDGRVIEGVREVNAALCDILVLDYEQFKKISMIAQGEFARLLVAPPKEKTAIFREIFGTGIYDRFTQILGARARELYGKVMEHKNKMDEDIRLLTEGIGKSLWTDEDKNTLLELVSGKDWNYKAIAGLLARMEEEARQETKGLEEQFRMADKQVVELTEALTRQTDINKRWKNLREVTSRREELAHRQAEFLEKQETYNQAVNAGFLESADNERVQLQNQLQKTVLDGERIQREWEDNKEEQKMLAPHVERAEQVRKLLTIAQTAEELRKMQEKLDKELLAKKEKLSGEQAVYLQKEQEMIACKQVYENAERNRRLAAIGLAAELLKVGEPCPVCGSLEHPNPAKVDVDVVSEEELEALKEDYEASMDKLRKMQEELAALKTRTETLGGQAEENKAKLTETNRILAEEKDAICVEYLKNEPEQSLRRINEKCRRADALTGLLEEKKNAMERLKQARLELEEQIQSAEETFGKELKNHNFADEEAYRKAKLSKQEREHLSQEITSYHNQTASAEELYQHLAKEVQNTKEEPLTDMQEALDLVQMRKAEILKLRRIWDGQLTDVQKVRKMMRDRQSQMEKDRNAYGYVKDLENMANGNNARKLVFEQYVLAGYFEEILRAANLRFLKMTGGQYEMARAEQVGDGRVKDNLEILVFNHFSGKYRSIRTVSGGETFKASLCLALGMSDVIQAMNGGIKVDTLFVDEGFGSLDGESLELACDTLMGLAEKNKMIGIISHVPELRARMDQKLIVEKSNFGSRIVQ